MRALFVILALLLAAQAPAFQGQSEIERIIAIGDSITQPYGPTPFAHYACYIASERTRLLAKRPGEYVGVRFVGLNGASWTNGYGGAAGTVFMASMTNLVTNRPANIPCKAILFAGSNGMALSNAPASAEFTGCTNTINYLLTNQVAPWTASNILVITMLPREGSNNMPTLETNRQFYNNLIITNAAVWGYRYYDVRSNSLIGIWTAQSNLTGLSGGFVDTIHPGAPGHQQIGLSAAPSLQ
jgi:lysophospholipase L1-like esterase